MGFSKQVGKECMKQRDKRAEEKEESKIRFRIWLRNGKNCKARGTWEQRDRSGRAPSCQKKADGKTFGRAWLIFSLCDLCGTVGPAEGVQQASQHRSHVAERKERAEEKETSQSVIRIWFWTREWRSKEGSERREAGQPGPIFILKASLFFDWLVGGVEEIAPPTHSAEDGPTMIGLEMKTGQCQAVFSKLPVVALFLWTYESTGGIVVGYFANGSESYKKWYLKRHALQQSWACNNSSKW